MKQLFALAAIAVAVLPLDAGAPGSTTGSRTLVDQSYLCMITLADLRSMRLALAEYVIDHGLAPATSSIEELRPLLEPAYMRSLAARDAWGTEFRYRPSADRKSFLVASAGSDRQFDEAGWGTPGLVGDSRADAVLGSDERPDREWTVQR